MIHTECKSANIKKHKMIVKNVKLNAYRLNIDNTL